MANLAGLAIQRMEMIANFLAGSVIQRMEMIANLAGSS
jgi:hypothetical protein